MGKSIFVSYEKDFEHATGLLNGPENAQLFLEYVKARLMAEHYKNFEMKMKKQNSYLKRILQRLNN